MKTFTERISWIAVLLLVTSLFIIGCGDDETEDAEDLLLEEEAAAGGGALIEVPPAYVFDSRFVEGESSVAYSGQTVRNLLLQDLKVLIDSLGKDGAQPANVQDMLNLYAYDDALNMQSLSTAGALSVLESRYSAISTGKSLVGKFREIWSSVITVPLTIWCVSGSKLSPITRKIPRNSEHPQSTPTTTG